MAKSGIPRYLQVVVLLLTQLLFSALVAHADVQAVYNFGSADGSYPYSNLVKDAAGNLYGTTYYGGDNGYGCVFQIDAYGDEYVLYSFSGPDGKYPYGNIAIDSAGNIYGTCGGGGANNYGTVFKLDAGDVLTTLHDFTNGADGAYPYGVIRDSSNNLYGVSGGDDSTIFGTLFKISASHVFSTLATFSGPNGKYPYSALARDSSGNLYGTCASGGANNYGTVFKYSFASGLSTLHDFTNGADGANPYTGVSLDSSNSLYGTSYSGGTGNYGVVYKITSANAFSVLCSFTGGLDGGHPYSAPIRDKSGNLYGTTASGGNNGDGTVYRLNPTTGVLYILHHFQSDTFYGAYSSLFRDTTGTIYGAAAYSGSGYGAIFKVTYPYTASLYNFNYTDGYDPYAGMISDSAGNLYGTCSGGGANGYGTVFKLSPTAQLTTLYNFNGTDGNSPTCVLVRDSSGNLYGTTRYGGAYDNGTIFKLSPTSGLTVLYNFTNGNDGANPSGGLIRDSSGNLYGTTTFGGVNNNGTIFKLSQNGVLTTLFTFTYTVNGAFPGSTLLRDSAGNLYGTCSSGGPSSGHGVVFKLSPSNVFTILHTFAGGIEGDYPYGSLIRDSVGNLYGTTAAGGGGGGIVYKLDTHNRLFKLHSFSAGVDGGYSFASLIRDSAGNLYGVNDLYGLYNSGTVFKLSASNVLTTLSNFSTVDSNGKNSYGAEPFGGLVRDSKGNLYGVGSIGGLYSYGSIFALLY